MNNDINNQSTNGNGQIPNQVPVQQPTQPVQPVQPVQPTQPVQQSITQPVQQAQSQFQQPVQSPVNPQPVQNSNMVVQQTQTSNTSSQTIQTNQAVKKKSISADKIVELIKKNKLIVIGILVLVVVVAIFTKGGKSGGIFKNTGANNSNVSDSEKLEEQKRLEEEALKGTFVIGAYRLKYPEGYTLKDTIDGTIILTDESDHRIELSLEKYKTAYKKSTTLQADVADLYALDGYETRECGLQKINQTPWAIYTGYRDETYKTIAYVEFQSKMLKIQLENDSLEYNSKIIEEFTELIKHVVKK